MKREKAKKDKAKRKKERQDNREENEGGSGRRVSVFGRVERYKEIEGKI